MIRLQRLREGCMERERERVGGSNEAISGGKKGLTDKHGILENLCHM